MTEPPTRLCCGQKHYGPVCPDGKVMCCLCFARFEQHQLNTRWDDKEMRILIIEDVCKPCAAAEKAIMEKRQASPAPLPDKA